MFSDFWPNLTGPGRYIHELFSWHKLFTETTRSVASIEPLIDLLACQEPKILPKNPTVPQNQKIAENALGLPLAAFWIAIPRHKILLASYSIPPKIREFL